MAPADKIPLHNSKNKNTLAQLARKSIACVERLECPCNGGNPEVVFVPLNEFLEVSKSRDGFGNLLHPKIHRNLATWSNER